MVAGGGDAAANDSSSISSNEVAEKARFEAEGLGGDMIGLDAIELLEALGEAGLEEGEARVLRTKALLFFNTLDGFELCANLASLLLGLTRLGTTFLPSPIAAAGVIFGGGGMRPLLER